MILKKYYQIFSLLVVVATVYYSFYSLSPSISDTSDLKTTFSTEKALLHIKQMSVKPHYVGSPEHAVVRSYLVNELTKLGLQVDIQEQIAINSKWFAATNCKNILARIKGSEPGKALLLASHYDSNPHSSLGASDAASGVAVILEGIRAFLAKNHQPKNDIIICITDAEELGLLGAKAFVNHHPWAKDVGLVLNFEARGSGGPSYMLMETNQGNINLIEAFQQAETPYPVGNSLMYSVYKMLPNDTDLTIFREDGDIDGFNFAFIGDHFDYHTEQDSYNRMDLKSLNHQATYLESLLTYFSENNLDSLKAEEDMVYFNFPYFGMVFYPFSWIVPMYLVCVFLFLLLIVLGILKNKLTLKGIIIGFVSIISSLLFSGFLTFYGWKLLLVIHPQYKDILHGFTYNGYYYIIVFVSFTLAVCFWLFRQHFKKRSLQDLVVGSLLLWILINGGIAFYLKGAAFFILPVIILLSILTILIFSSSEKKTGMLFTGFSVPVLIIFAPMIKLFPVGLGLNMLIIAAIFTVLLFGFLIPVLKQYKKQRTLSKLFLFIGILALVSASLSASYSNERKKPNSIMYVWDTHKNEAYWATYNQRIDTFTKQFLGENPIKGGYDKHTGLSKYKTKVEWHTKTPVKNLEKPLISVLSDTVVDKNRKVCLSIVSARNAHKISLMTNKPVRFKSVRVNEEELKTNSNSEYVLSVGSGTIMSYYITGENEIIDLEFVADKDELFDFDILESKYDLFTNPNFEIEPRSETMIPMPFVLNDATVIKTNIKF